MIPEAAIWAIIGLPLASFLFIALVMRPFLNGYTRWSAYLTILALAGSLIISVWVFTTLIGNPSAIEYESHVWFTIGGIDGKGFDMTVGILLDPLSSIMLIVVSGVSLLVQVYSQGYMRGDGGYSRYFAYMSLFTAAMLGVVLSKNLIQMFFFWELVGLSSFLLIGFWYQRPAAVAAAKKAFIITRIGDFGFLLALLYLFSHRLDFTARGLNPFEIPDIHQAAGFLAAGVLTWLALGIFAGAIGKSAQFPLHTWLPDAMEGPTPVSSLIHAATMVAAGIFLVARMFPLFEHSGTALNVVALLGAFTAVFAATMGLVSNDIKRVLAYSTVSQLGYMMLALGIGAPAVAIFHLFNHAFFKCLLFLSAGNVNHAVGTFDMRYMGGLRKAMPLTYGATLIGAFSLMGIFPFSGFWSKDELLAVAWGGDHAASGLVSAIAFYLALIGVFLTAAYIFRLIHLTFHGEFRGGAGAQAVDEHVPNGAHQIHLAEAPFVMIAPMMILAVLALSSGFLANPTINFLGIPAHAFSEFLGEKAPAFNWSIVAASSLLVLVGIGCVALPRWRFVFNGTRMGKFMHSLQVLASQRYYMDHFYEGFLVRRILYGGVFRFTTWLDEYVVDGVVDLMGWSTRNMGRSLSYIQTGQVQAYGAAISLGLVVILVVYLNSW